tara:strand:- start:609 stop:1271 length:663 start_codon:yes stop_codon:yes gene_type:complete
MTIRYSYFKTDVCKQYRSFHSRIQQFISGWVVQQLLYEKSVVSCYGLHREFNNSITCPKEKNSQYWHKLVNGMSIQNSDKIEAIESFSPGITQYLCHPLCFLLNLPNRYFFSVNGVIQTRQMPIRIKNQVATIQQFDALTEEEHSSIYLATLNKLCPLLIDGCNACLKHDFIEVRKLRSEIEHHLSESLKTWRYPKTANFLSNLINNKLDRLTAINLKHH